MSYQIFTLTLILQLTLTSARPAQKKSSGQEPPSALCTREFALDTINQQIAVTRTFDNLVQRISVLIRAADLLWPYQEKKARAAFAEAFALAVQDFKSVGDEPRRLGKFAMTVVPDQRYRVIAALAKRDGAAASKMTNEMLRDEERNFASKGSDENYLRKTGEKLLDVARNLASTNAQSATTLAKRSFGFPATFYLPMFIYELAKTNRVTADEFYEAAVGAYASAPMEQFLYLSSYPFGNTRDAGEMPGYTIYKVPEGFTPNATLQQLFVRSLLGRLPTLTAGPTLTDPSGRLSDAEQIWLALNRLERQIQQSVPELHDPVQRAKAELSGLLSQSSLGRMSRILSEDNPPRKSFAELLEAAEKLSDIDRRNQQITSAVTRGAQRESVESVLKALDKITEENVRGALLNWFYFFRTQSLVGENKLQEARALAAKVTELDQRAYLYSRIAEQYLKSGEDQSQARELLEEISQAAARAPQTIVTSRALLALAYLYARIDTNRGIQELSNAVKAINRLEAPDFSVEFVHMKIEGKTFGSYASFGTPGFNPERAFREIGKIDFDGTINQAAGLTEKSLRALTTLALIEPCLEAASKREF